MSAIPLSLEGIQYEILHVEALPGSVPTAQNYNAEIGVEIARNPAEPHRWVVRLRIAVGPEHGRDVPPYRIEIVVLGYFGFRPKSTEKDILSALRIAGASILYSSSREMVLTLTARGTAGAYQLPLVSFSTMTPASETRVPPMGVRERPATNTANPQAARKTRPRKAK